MLSYEQYPDEKFRLWLSSFEKKIDQPSWRTSRHNYKHMIVTKTWNDPQQLRFL